MMNTYEVYQLQIVKDGIIEVLKETKSTYNGQEITLERWRTTLTPLDKDYAKEILPAYYFNICEAVWTDDVIESYHA